MADISSSDLKIGGVVSQKFALHTWLEIFQDDVSDMSSLK